MISWLECLVRGSRRRSKRRSAARHPVCIELLEDRTLLSAVPFSEQSISAAVDGATAVHVADIDGDGRLDVLTASFEDDEITLWRNGGGADPTFTPTLISNSVDGPRSVFAADMDGDGDLDVLAASFNDSRIVWYENIGDTSAPWTEHEITNQVDPVTLAPRTTTAEGATSVFAADLDRDGDMDVVSASANDDKIAWYRNDGDGGTVDPDVRLIFTEEVISTTADFAQSVFVADVDGDGDLDVLSASSGDPAIPPDPNNPNPNDDKIAWYENDGAAAPTFTERVITTNAEGASSVFAADVDGDGDVDVLSAAAESGVITLHKNSGGGVFPAALARTIGTGNGASAVAAGDMDGDGDLDVIAAFEGSNRVQWFENDSDPFFETFVPRTISETADGVRALAVADLDGDGDLDAVSAAFLGDEIMWHRNETIHRNAAFPLPSNPAFPSPVVLSDQANAVWSIVSGDVDGDGDIDLVASTAGATGTGNQILLFRNGGKPADPSIPNPSFTVQTIATIPGGSPRGLHMADVDHDGDLDVLAASATNNQVIWLVNDGFGGFTQSFIDTGAVGATAVWAADINGDGAIDILSASDDGTIAWYISNGAPAPTFTKSVITTLADGAQSVEAADFDGDGDLDVLVASRDDDRHRIRWYENSPSVASPTGIAWQPHTITLRADGARWATAVDLDGDGDLDVLAASTFDGRISWFENDGSQNPLMQSSGNVADVPEHVLSDEAQNVQFVTFADLDSDGDLDVLAAATFTMTDPADPSQTLTTRLGWFERDGLNPDGSPRFVLRPFDTGSDRPFAIATADLDRDGKLDIITGSRLDDAVIWYENLGGQVQLATTDTTPRVFTGGESQAVFRIDVTHNGRAGDSAVELTTLKLQFEEQAGDPLTSAEANRIIFDLEIIRDDNGNGAFDAGDTSVAVVKPLSLDLEGIQTVTFADDDANVQLSQGTSQTYFVVIELAANAFTQSPRRFLVTHLTEGGLTEDGFDLPVSTTEDASADVPTSLEFFPNTTTAQVDIAAPSVVTPGRPVVGGPAAVVADTTPTITWSAPAGAEHYELLVYSVTRGREVVRGTDIRGTSFTVPADRPLDAFDTYQVFVRAFNVANTAGRFSTAEYFSVDTSPRRPSQAVLTGPAADLDSTTPRITWTASDGATSYELHIYNMRIGQLALRETGITGTSFTPPVALLTDVPYQVFVRAHNEPVGGPSVAGSFSSPLVFVTNPASDTSRPSLTGPAARVPDATPTITWTAAAGALSYNLQIYDVAAGRLLRNEPAVAGTEFTPGAGVLGPGRFQVFVRANRGGGEFSAFSEPLVFNVTSNAPVPGISTIRSPLGATADGTPRIIWDRLDHAASFDLVIFNVAAGREVLFRQGLGARSFEPGGALVPGVYQVHVRGLNTHGEAGGWSFGHRFQIAQSDVAERLPLEQNGAEPAEEPSDSLPAVPAANEDGLFLAEAAEPRQSVSRNAAAEDHATTRSLEDAAGENAAVLIAESSAATADSAGEANRVSRRAEQAESLDAVMAEWPATDWWLADEPAGVETGDGSDGEMLLAGAMLGLGWPALQEKDRIAAADGARRPGRRPTHRRVSRNNF